LYVGHPAGYDLCLTKREALSTLGLWQEWDGVLSCLLIIIGGFG